MKKEKSTVGKSSRTPYKHWLYRAMLGKMVGAAATGKTPCRGVVKVLDMCAGDGAHTDGDPLSSSPAIADRHMTSDFPLAKRLRAREAFLYERETLTFARLNDRFGGRPHMHLNNADSNGVTLRDIGAVRGEGVFVYADPNSIGTLPVTRQLVESFTETTLFLMTLGCNVGGVKRMPVEERMGWLKVVRMASRSRKIHHDVILFTLNNDASQWAYLAAFPRKWAEDFQKAGLRNGLKHWPGGVSAFSANRQPSQFEAKLKELFYTAKEIEEMQQSRMTL